MALIKCRECGKQVSSEVATCPHCGVTTPSLMMAVATGNPSAVAQARTNLIAACITAAVVLGFAGLLCYNMVTPDTDKPMVAAQDTASDRTSVAARAQRDSVNTEKQTPLPILIAVDEHTVRFHNLSHSAIGPCTFKVNGGLISDGYVRHAATLRAGINALTVPLSSFLKGDERFDPGRQAVNDLYASCDVNGVTRAYLWRPAPQ